MHADSLTRSAAINPLATPLAPTLRDVHELMRAGHNDAAEALLLKLRELHPTCAELYDTKLAELRGRPLPGLASRPFVPFSSGASSAAGPLAGLLVLVLLEHEQRRQAIVSTWHQDLVRNGGELCIVRTSSAVDSPCRLGVECFLPAGTAEPVAVALKESLARGSQARWVLVLADDCHLDVEALAPHLAGWRPSARVAAAVTGATALFAPAGTGVRLGEGETPDWLTQGPANDPRALPIVGRGCEHLGHFERRQQRVEAARWARARQTPPEARFMHPRLGLDESLGFDHVYLVNLRSEVDRRTSALLDLEAHGIRAELVSALDGQHELGSRLFEQVQARPVGTLQRYPQHGELERYRARHFIDSRGAVGYILTYVGLLRDAQRRGFRKILIVEDDVLLTRDLRPRLAALLQKIGDDYLVLQLGASQYDWSGIDEAQAQRAGHYLATPLHTCGSFAMALDCRVIDELVEALLWFEAPFDHLPLGEIYERHPGRCFVAYPNLVMPVVTHSNIRGPRDQHEHARRMRWPIDEFRFPRPCGQVAVLLAPGVPVPAGETVIHGLSLLYLRHGVDGLRAAHPVPRGHPSEPAESHVALDVLRHATADLAFELRRPAQAEEIVAELLHQLAAWPPSPPMARDWLCRLPLLRSGLVVGRATVIVPTRGRREPLEHALRSVLAQDHPDLEVLVVNENAPDSELSEWLRTLVVDLSGSRTGLSLRLLQHHHARNAAAARNTGLLAASGEFVSFLDDDDAYLAGRVSRLVELLEASPPHVAAAYCGYLGWNSQASDPARYPTDDLVWRMLALEYGSHYICTDTVTYRTRDLLAINGFDEAFRRHQDLEMNARFFARHGVVSLPEPLVQLNPLLADSTNKLFGEALFQTKRRFLDKFADTVTAFGPRASLLLRRHADELRDYADASTDLVDLALEHPGTLSSAMLQQQLGRTPPQRDDEPV